MRKLIIILVANFCKVLFYLVLVLKEKYLVPCEFSARSQVGIISCC